MIDDMRRHSGCARDGRIGIFGLELQQLRFVKAWWTIHTPATAASTIELAREIAAQRRSGPKMTSGPRDLVENHQRRTSW